MSDDSLSGDDIAKLMQNPTSVPVQMEVVGKLLNQYNATGDGALSSGQNAQADDVFKVLLSRTEVQVRAMMALSLKQSTKLPPELAKKMAADVAEVALPIIEFSKVLSDTDLLDIINATKEEGKLVAIAKRETVSEAVSAALVETKIEAVATTLVKNEGAAINEQTFSKIVDYHADSASVMGSMLERGGVPAAVIEKLVESVSASITKQLETKYGNLGELKDMRKALNQSMEMTRFQLMGLKTSDSQLTRMISYLDENNMLQPFTALCMANLEIFEVSIARILRIPASNVHRLIKDINGLRAVYTNAKLPAEMFDAVALTVRAILDMQIESGVNNHVPTPMKVVERMRKMAGGRKVQNVERICAMMVKDWSEVW